MTVAEDALKAGLQVAHSGYSYTSEYGEPVCVRHEVEAVRVLMICETKSRSSIVGYVEPVTNKRGRVAQLVSRNLLPTSARPKHCRHAVPPSVPPDPWCEARMKAEVF
jgi:hypothetical protein